MRCAEEKRDTDGVGPADAASWGDSWGYYGDIILKKNNIWLIYG